MSTTLSYSDSVASTPELSSPSSTSSNDSSSFRSALSSDDWNSIDAEAPPTAPTPLSTTNSGHSSPLLMRFPSKAKSVSSSVLSSVKNITSSANGTMFGSSFGEQRRPDRRKPTPLSLVDPFDGFVTLSGSSMAATSSTDVPIDIRGRSTTVRSRSFLGRRESSRIQGVRPERMGLQRINSLPSIPSATLFPISEPLPEVPSSESEKVVRFNTEETETSLKLLGGLPNHSTRSVSDRNTNAMASLAWTGTLPSALPSSFPITNTDLSSSAHPMNWALTSACRSTWSLCDSTDPGSPLFSSTSNLSFDDDSLPLPHSETRIISEADRRRHQRRWTLAMVITDDEISDEKLVDKLEKMMVGNTGGHISSGWQENTGLQSPLSATLLSAAIPSSNICGSPREDLEMESQVVLGNIEKNVNVIQSPLTDNHFSQSSVWKSAQRTLLVCRELVLTERSYLSYLQIMLSQVTTTPPPALLLAYIPDLILVSEKLLSRMEINPSAVGVAETFLLYGEQLELAFVGWCGVVGGFFAGAYDGDRASSIKRARTSSASFGRKDNRKEGPIDSSVKRRVGSWGKRISSIRSRSRSWSMTRRGANPSVERTASMIDVSMKEKPDRKTGRCAHSVRELAILPTQRVMRYTLLFRDLVAYTPSSSSSREEVQMALEAAVTLAQKCDKAQGNSAFLHEPR
ncbi:hypothetical protein J3R30DRAFT_3704063 [Lentinula aciculospora]|uniref:DH domain-containing protein n=1 Tax=Lentinula aciculospora TaxID=153920 RepID=A0A9W9DLW0_9AGAR|nr:hypothetical protein J3R30DRAFT_3704063 [Lentinula aciculospora]